VVTLMNSALAIGTTAEVIETETYACDKHHIPRAAVPVGINLWCFQRDFCQRLWVIVCSFEFAPE
jgi:hypothetical protein